MVGTSVTPTFLEAVSSGVSAVIRRGEATADAMVRTLSGRLDPVLRTGLVGPRVGNFDPLNYSQLNYGGMK